MPSINLEKPPGEAFKSLTRKAIRACQKDVAALAAGGGAHEPRKRLKYLNSLFSLLRFALGRPDYREAKARIGRAAELLADARRAEAHGEATAKLKGDGPALAELDAIATQAHADAATPDAIAAAAAAALREIDGLKADLRGWSLPKRDVSLYLKAMKRTYRRARRAVLEGLAAKDSATLHEARKSVIHHLHHLEILEPLWPDLIGVWVAELTRLRTALGDLNDLSELQELIDDRTTEFSSAERRDEAADAIKLSREALLKRTAKHVRRLFAETPSGFSGRIGIMWIRAAART